MLQHRPLQKSKEKQAKIKAFSFYPETIAKLNELRDIHHARFRQERYPNLSAVLEKVISSQLEAFYENEGMLEGNILDMRQKYSAAATVKTPTPTAKDCQMTVPLHESDEQRAARREKLRLRSQKWRREHPTYHSEWAAKQKSMVRDHPGKGGSDGEATGRG